MATRIKDLTTTATGVANDDYIAVDGATNGTRKILASDIGGGAEYDFESSLTPSIDSRGVSAYSASVTPTDSSVMTPQNILGVKAYLYSTAGGGQYVYPLNVVYSSVGSTSFVVQLKSLHGNPQNTSSTTISGKLHVVAPFEISSVGAYM